MFLLSPFSFLLHFTSSFQLFLFSPSFSTSPRLPPFLFAHWVLQPRSEGERFDCSHLRLSPLLFCLWIRVRVVDNDSLTSKGEELAPVVSTTLKLEFQFRKKIDELMLKNPETASEISPNDPIGVIFGKEHPGRVRELLYGACPTLAFQQSTTRIRGINFASPNAASPHDEDKFVKIENELATVKNQVQTLLAYIASKEDVPEHVATMVAGLAPDIESGVPSPHEILGSSGGSKTS